MIESLTKKQRQILALSILVMIITIFTLLIVQLVALNRHYVDTIDQLEQRLDILQRTAASGNSLRSQHEQLKQLLDSNRQYLKSATESLAAADLQGIVKRISATNAMEVLSTQILPAIKESDFTGVTLKVRMRGKLDNLVKVLYTLETELPYLFLDAVSIRSQFQHTSNINLLEQLDVEFNLTGYMPGQS